MTRVIRFVQGQTSNSPPLLHTQNKRLSFSVSRGACREMSVSSSPPGCRSFGQNCRTGGPWCFAGWAGRCPAGVSGKGLRSSRPPSAASTPRQTWTNAPAASLKAANAHRVTQSSQRSVDAVRQLALVTFLDVGPQLVFTGAFLKGFWEFDGAGAEIPEEDPKRVHVDGVIVLSCAKKPKHTYDQELM